MPSKDGLIDERVSVKQCKLAVEALYSHEAKRIAEAELKELLPGKEVHVWLNVALKQTPLRAKVKPVKIPVVHPLVDPRTSSICLITKDPQREYKDLLEQHNIKFISRVVGIEKLKGKFKPFEARRMLLKENGLFLADDRVIPLLPKLLGAKWFEAKKQPLPVRLTKKDLKGELERAISSTYMNQNKGTCTSVKFGLMSQKPAQIFANLKVALPAVAEHVQGGWDNIQALYIKTNSSASLPIWTCDLGESEEGQWNGISGEDLADIVSSTQEQTETSHDPKEPGEDKGKKRLRAGGKRPEKPKKKAKGGDDAFQNGNTSQPITKTAILTHHPPNGASKPSSAVADMPKKKTKKGSSLDPQPSNPVPKTKTPVSVNDSSNSRKKTGDDGASPTTEKLKGKCSGGPAERKKNIVKSLGGKRAKDGILGKKAGRHL